MANTTLKTKKSKKNLKSLLLKTYWLEETEEGISIWRFYKKGGNYDGKALLIGTNYDVEEIGNYFPHTTFNLKKLKIHNIVALKLRGVTIKNDLQN